MNIWQRFHRWGNEPATASTYAWAWFWMMTLAITLWLLAMYFRSK